MKYILVEFPEVQDYMDLEWFEDEAHVCVDIDGAFFIPEERYLK